ncbi:MAG: serine hydroxymethyltransferase [Deltaproteobacteria bacterium]|nr:serine hydroxymethyltransferase [Deltaproteobacteria bacterium]
MASTPFDPPLAIRDPDMARLIDDERVRQHQKLRMIPSENYASRAVLEATGSVLNNKYSEGYAGKRYYEGQQIIDVVERLAIDRVKALFGVDHVNVQPYSGSPANLAVYLAFCNPGDVVMGMGLPAGGHLTHGWSVSITGKYFRSVAYGVRRDDHRIDLDEVRRLARESKPKILWVGATAYPRTLDYAAFAEIAREVGAVLCADIAHISGLVIGRAHPSPVGLAEVVTSTTHKTFRGPRGGMILCDAKHASAIDKAVFPGLQGGPHNSNTAAIAVAAHEAAQPEFGAYAHQVVANAKTLAEGLVARGLSLVTGGTDNHLVLADLSPKGVPGKVAARALDRAGVVVNYNSVPFDTRKPFDPSGIRLGTPALTTRGMREAEMSRVAEWIARIVDHPEDEATIERTRGEVAEVCASFPAPGLGLD